MTGSMSSSPNERSESSARSRTKPARVFVKRILADDRLRLLDAEEDLHDRGARAGVAGGDERQQLIDERRSGCWPPRASARR